MQLLATSSDPFVQWLCDQFTPRISSTHMANLCLPTSRLFISRPLVPRTGRVRSKQPTTQIYSAGQHRRMSNADCLFCKIVAGKIPSEKLYESDKTFAFLDIGPLSKGHAVSSPQWYGFPQKLLTGSACDPETPRDETSRHSGRLLDRDSCKW